MLSVFQNTSITVVSFPESYNAILCILSCVLSIVGCFAILYSYIRWSEERTLARLIVMCIAVADMFTASGYLVMSSYFLSIGVLGNTYNRSLIYEDPQYGLLRGLCSAQSLVTTTSSNWSFWWTTTLAVHMYLGFVWNKWAFSKRIFPLYFFLCWGIPLLYSIPAMATGWLGLGCSHVSVTWCFVGINYPYRCDYWLHNLLEAVEGKLWEISAFLIILVLYVRIWIQLVAVRRKRSDTERSLLLSSRKSSTVIDWTVLLIPLVFLFIRSWGTLRYFLSLQDPGGHPETYDKVLASFQAVFDPSQGWTNALIFLVLSRRSIDVLRTACSSLKRCVQQDVTSLKDFFSRRPVLAHPVAQGAEDQLTGVSYLEVSARLDDVEKNLSEANGHSTTINTS